MLGLSILVTGFIEESHGSPNPKKKIPQIIGIANSFLGIPYRLDGAVNILGLYTSFNHPHKVFSEPGLNCSGFLLGVVREIYRIPITMKMVEKDRKQDSGTGAKMGHDWDYGLDFILNLVDAISHKPRMVVPEYGDWDHARGFNLHKKQLWQSVLRQIKPGHLYLFSINKDTRKLGYRYIHYHVGLIIPENTEHAWFYHSTKKSKVHRMDLKSKNGLNRFFYQFAESRIGPKYIYILEVPQPNLVN